MKRFSIFLLLSVVFGLFVTPMTMFAQTSISVDHVDGLYVGKIQPDSPIGFHIRWTNNSGSSVNGGNPGYRVFLRNNIELPDGIFEPLVVDSVPDILFDMFDGFFGVNYFSNDGVGSDTVAFGGFKIMGTGLPNGFDDVVASIQTSVSADFGGDSLCIDSSFNPPTGIWKWASSSGDYIPDWSGPHCYEILSSCCVGDRGNINGSPDDQLDIADLEFIITFMFRGGSEPPCFEESDLDGDGSRDVSDLVALVSYMFLAGPPPASCF